VDGGYETVLGSQVYRTPHNKCRLLAVATCRVALPRCSATRRAALPRVVFHATLQATRRAAVATCRVALPRCSAARRVAFILPGSTGGPPTIRSPSTPAPHCGPRRRARLVAPIHAAGGTAAAAAHAEHSRAAAESKPKPKPIFREQRGSAAHSASRETRGGVRAPMRARTCGGGGGGGGRGRKLTVMIGGDGEKHDSA
jgi:hypothetical protein